MKNNKAFILILVLLIGLPLFYLSSAPNIQGQPNKDTFGDILNSISPESAYHSTEETIKNTVNVFEAITSVITGITSTTSVIVDFFTIRTNEYKNETQTELSKIIADTIINNVSIKRSEGWFLKKGYTINFSNLLTSIEPYNYILIYVDSIYQYDFEITNFLIKNDSYIVIHKNNFNNLELYTNTTYLVFTKLIIIPLLLENNMISEELAKRIESSKDVLLKRFSHFYINQFLSNVPSDTFKNVGNWVTI